MGIQADLEFAITKWQKDIDVETINLIEAGIAPDDAAEAATRIVSSRRRDRNADKSGQ